MNLFSTRFYTLVFSFVLLFCSVASADGEKVIIAIDETVIAPFETPHDVGCLAGDRC